MPQFKIDNALNVKIQQNPRKHRANITSWMVRGIVRISLRHRAYINTQLFLFDSSSGLWIFLRLRFLNLNRTLTSYITRGPRKLQAGIASS
jgi:hypothetical protein